MRTIHINMRRLARSSAQHRATGYFLRCVCVVVFSWGIIGCATTGMRLPAAYATKERLTLGYKTIVIRELSESWSLFEKSPVTPVYRFEAIDEKGYILQEWFGCLHTERGDRRTAPRMSWEEVSRVDSLHQRGVWRVRDTLSYPQEDSPIIVYWSVDSISNGQAFPMFKVPVASERSSVIKKERGSREYMENLQQQARQYVYFDLKRYVLSRVAEL